MQAESSSEPTSKSPSFDARSFLATLPDLPGVYRMIGEAGAVLYVGKAKNLKKRVSSYFQKTLSSPRIAHMVGQINHIETTVTRSEAEALLLESNLIKSLAPRYNILFRDDKSYPYIVLTRGTFPKLGFFRGKPDRKADYFGPFPSAGAVRESLQLLQKTFRLRTCEDSVFLNRSRPCLLYQIRRCSGSCVDLISPDEYAQDVQHATLFLLGKQQEVSQRLTERMENAAAALAFEQAAAYRDQIQALRRIQERQYVSSNKGEEADILVAVADEFGHLCVNLAMVRDGQHLGDRPLFPSQASDASPTEVLSAFIVQHYAVHPIPARLMTWPSIPETDDCLDWLNDLAKRAVPVMEPRHTSHKVWVDMAIQNAKLALLARNQTQNMQAKRLESLQLALGLEDPIDRIECFDISHTQGEATVASCVVYQRQGMARAEYRRFNISGITPGDDYAAMEQAVSRRYGKLAGQVDLPENTDSADKPADTPKSPDLILIDGGKGQVSVAWQALQELGLSIPMIGVAKGEGRKAGLESLIFPDSRQPLQFAPEHPALHLIQEIRDEAHRFAITGHRARRAKTRNRSNLEDIAGIGPVRRKALMTHFGGLSGIGQATIEQLTQVPGISQDLAETIYAALH